MIGIYKITNLINNDCYIGQSINIYNRWEKEKNNAFNPNAKCYNYPLYKAIRKYGVQNFSFEIIEECLRKELNEKETYRIKYYDSYYNGYNQTPGGDSTLHMCKLTPEQAQEIIDILSNDKNSEISHKELAEKYNVSKDTIQAINAGRQWYNDNYQYPLHTSKYDPRLKKQKHIKKINTPPITKEELKQLLLDNKGNFTKVGKILNISDNGLRKWCKKLNLPTHSGDYKINNTKQINNTNYLRSVCCIEENLVFPFAAEAARWLVANGKSQSFNSSKNQIPKVCQGKRQTHAGYHWKYI